MFAFSLQVEVEDPRNNYLYTFVYDREIGPANHWYSENGKN